VGKNILRKFHIHFPKGTTYDLREGVVSRPGALRTYWTRRKDLVLSSHESLIKRHPDSSPCSVGRNPDTSHGYFKKVYYK
jgi:hypothetical protein